MALKEDEYILNNLWPLYVHEVNGYARAVPNIHGVYSDDPEMRATPGPGNYWKDPEVTFLYLIWADEWPVGFFLIITGPLLPSDDLDFEAREFFVMSAYRGTDVATVAAKEGIARHPGRWEVVTYPNTPRPAVFWRKVLPRCVSGTVHEEERDHPYGRKIVFRFART